MFRSYGEEKYNMKKNGRQEERWCLLLKEAPTMMREGVSSTGGASAVFTPAGTRRSGPNPNFVVPSKKSPNGLFLLGAEKEGLSEPCERCFLDSLAKTR